MSSVWFGGLAEAAVLSSVNVAVGSGTAGGVGVSFYTLFPEADITDGGWTTESGTTTLFSSIDEVVANDSDFIRSSNNPSSDTCEISLSNPATGPVGEEIIVEYRYAKVGGSQIDLTVSLMEGVTTIASWTHTNIGTTEVTAQQTLSAGEVAAITDYTALSLRFVANKP